MVEVAHESIGIRLDPRALPLEAQQAVNRPEGESCLGRQPQSHCWSQVIAHRALSSEGKASCRLVWTLIPQECICEGDGQLRRRQPQRANDEMWAGEGLRGVAP